VWSGRVARAYAVKCDALRRLADWKYKAMRRQLRDVVAWLDEEYAGCAIGIGVDG